MIKVPFSLVPSPVLLRWSEHIQGISNRVTKLFPKLKHDLKHLEEKIDEIDYVGMCLIGAVMLSVFFYILALLPLLNFEQVNPYLVAIPIALFFTMFAFVQQVSYPKLLVSKRVRGIDRNLLSGLQDILIQINSGIPLYHTLVNVSLSDYGELSKEFRKVVGKIAAGYDEIESLEASAEKNPSLFYRRAIWQLVNGMKAGSDISDVIKDVIKSLTEEQLIGIQKYGSQLNPLAMFYMLAAVIFPSLGITFIIVISTFAGFSETGVKTIFTTLYLFVLLFQVMFMGVIKARRPILLSD